MWFYLRGEEYSAQLDHFVKATAAKNTVPTNDFLSAVETDHVIGMMLADAESGRRTAEAMAPVRMTPAKRKSIFGRL